MLLQDSLIPSSHSWSLETARKSEQTTHLVQTIRSICDSVFPNTEVPSRKNTHFDLPNGYTSLMDKLPKMNDPEQWSNTVIRALFDTMAMPPDSYGYRYGSPEQNIIMAFRVEVANPSKVASFHMLWTKLHTLSHELGSLNIHAHHRERIEKMISELLVFCDAV